MKLFILVVLFDVNGNHFLPIDSSFVESADSSKNSPSSVQSHTSVKTNQQAVCHKCGFANLVDGCLKLFGMKRSMRFAILYVGPSILDQDLHLIDQAQFSRLRTICATFEPRF